MVLVRQQKTAGFRPKSKYDIFVDQLSKWRDFTCKLFKEFFTCKSFKEFWQTLN